MGMLILGVDQAPREYWLHGFSYGHPTLRSICRMLQMHKNISNSRRQWDHGYMRIAFEVHYTTSTHHVYLSQVLIMSCHLLHPLIYVGCYKPNISQIKALHQVPVYDVKFFIESQGSLPYSINLHDKTIAMISNSLDLRGFFKPNLFANKDRMCTNIWLLQDQSLVLLQYYASFFCSCKQSICIRSSL